MLKKVKEKGSDYFYGTVTVDRTAIITAIVTAHARNHVLTIELKWLTTYHCLWEQSFLLLKSFLRVSKVMKKEILSHSIPEALALSKQRGEGTAKRCRINCSWFTKEESLCWDYS